MHILFVSGLLYPSSLGGPAKTIYWLGSALASVGVNVDIITTNGDISETDVIAFDKWVPINGMRVYYTNVNNCRGQFRSRWQYPVMAVIKKSCKENRYDIVVNCSLFYLPTFTAATYAKKIIWSPRGELLSPAIQNDIGKKLYIRLLKSLFKVKTIFHATSNAEEKAIKQYFGTDTRTFIIPNYMHIPAQCERNPKNKYLLYVGRFSPIKALDNLVEGIAKSKVFMDSDFKIVFVGAKEEKYNCFYESWLKQIDDLKLKDKVVFAGQIDGEAKYKMYANAYFSFLVSHSENFGNVVIESLSQGTPVVASKGTPWKELEDSKAGFWVDNTPKSIVDTINNILSMPIEKYEQYRFNARSLSTKFDVDKQIGMWMEVLREEA